MADEETHPRAEGVEGDYFRRTWSRISSRAGRLMREGCQRGVNGGVGGFQDRPKESVNTMMANELRLAPTPLTAQGKRAARKVSPDLARVMADWPDLPEAIKAGILAMVEASRARG